MGGVCVSEGIWFIEVDLVKNKFGFDEAFNYKEENDLEAALKWHTPALRRKRNRYSTDLRKLRERERERLTMSSVGGDGEEVRNRQVVLRDFVPHFPKESDMYVRTVTRKLKVPEGSNGILVKNLYLSCDPFMLSRMKEAQGHNVYGSFAPGSVALLFPLTGFGVSKVLDSRHPDFQKGDLVWGTTRWEEYQLIMEPKDIFKRLHNDVPEGLAKIQHTDVPLSYYISVLGPHGLTAFAGFYEVCSPNKGEYVFVSSAFGAIGQLVGQFAKLMGCYV